MSVSTNEKALWLARKIEVFLARYAKKHNDEYDDEVDVYNCPDAYELEAIVHLLKKGLVPKRMPWSDWESGGYAPYTSKEGKQEHDNVIEQIRELCGSLAKS